MHTFFLFQNLFLHAIEPILVIIEYVPYGDLLGYLRKSRGMNDTYYKDPDVKPQTSLTSLQLMKFSWQVADGMSYLSSRNVSWFMKCRPCNYETALYKKMVLHKTSCLMGFFTSVTRFCYFFQNLSADMMVCLAFVQLLEGLERPVSF